MDSTDERDYQNALRIINECKKYAEEQVKVLKGNYAWSLKDARKLVLLATYNNSIRGGSKVYLVFGGHKGIYVEQHYADGYISSKDISASQNPNCYSYNNSIPNTINLAFALANNWEEIKEIMKEEIEKFQKECSFKSKTLENFKVS